MKLLMFGWEFPPHNSGGLGVACEGLAKALAAKNIDLTFVLPRKLELKNDTFKFYFANTANINIIEIDSLLKAYLDTYSYKLLRENEIDVHENYAGTLYEEVERYGKLGSRIAKKNPHDVIHAHDWLAYGAGASAKRASGKPFVAHMHATEIDRTAGNPNEYIYKKEREGLNAADKIIAVSDYTKQAITKHYGIREDKVEVVHNGIDASKYDVTDTAPTGIENLKKLGYKVVLFVGRITIMKGADFLLDSFAQVVSKNPKTVLVIAGSGDMEAQIMNQAAHMGLSDKIVFAGFLRGNELSQAYKAADLFIMPSVSEPFGLVALEALVHKTPVIISRQSGVSELLKNVMKVDFWDRDEMSDQILSVLSHPSLKRDLADNGSREAHTCTWDRAADKCITIYNSL